MLTPPHSHDASTSINTSDLAHILEDPFRECGRFKIALGTRRYRVGCRRSEYRWRSQASVPLHLDVAKRNVHSSAQQNCDPCRKARMNGSVQKIRLIDNFKPGHFRREFSHETVQHTAPWTLE